MRAKLYSGMNQVFANSGDIVTRLFKALFGCMAAVWLRATGRTTRVAAAVRHELPQNIMVAAVAAAAVAQTAVLDLPGQKEFRRTRPSMLAGRLKCVARLNVRKGRKPVLRNLHPRNAVPRPAAAVARASKRSPTVVPVKRQKIKSKRPATRVIEAAPMRKSAVILRFPAGGRAGQRLKRAA